MHVAWMFLMSHYGFKRLYNSCFLCDIMFRLVDLDEKEKDEGPSWSRGADVMTTGKKHIK